MLQLRLLEMVQLKPRTVIALVLLATLVTGCTWPAGLGGSRQGQQAPPPAQTPEQALRYAMTLYETQEMPPDFHVLKMYAVPGVADTQLAYYRYLRLSGDTPPRPVPMIGLQFLLRKPNRWSPQGGQAIARTAPAEQVLDHIHATHTIGNTPITSILGLVLAPQVTMVEATFDNGPTVREPVAHESFVIVAPNTNGARELRALDTNGHVVRKFDLAQPVSAGR